MSVVALVGCRCSCDGGSVGDYGGSLRTVGGGRCVVVIVMVVLSFMCSMCGCATVHGGVGQCGKRSCHCDCGGGSCGRCGGGRCGGGRCGGGRCGGGRIIWNGRYCTVCVRGGRVFVVMVVIVVISRHQ